jgi:hypothetical protein
MSASPAVPAFAPSPQPHAAPETGAAARSDRAATLLGWAALALVLVLGVPVFLCMPVCFDTFHYDSCARNLLRGGVHYRDTFLILYLPWSFAPIAAGLPKGGAAV